MITGASKGAAEAIALNVQDLPPGVSAAFAPATITAGTTSTLTLTATASAPLTGAPAPTFTVIGKAPSAVHPATAQVAVSIAGPAGGADASARADAGALDGSPGADDGGASASDDGGCGCRTAQTRARFPAPVALGGLGLLAALRWRRRRRASALVHRALHERGDAAALNTRALVSTPNANC